MRSSGVRLGKSGNGFVDIMVGKSSDGSVGRHVVGLSAVAPSTPCEGTVDEAEAMEID